MTELVFNHAGPPCSLDILLMRLPKTRLMMADSFTKMFREGPEVSCRISTHTPSHTQEGRGDPSVLCLCVRGSVCLVYLERVADGVACDGILVCGTALGVIGAKCARLTITRRHSTAASVL